MYAGRMPWLDGEACGDKTGGMSHMIFPWYVVGSEASYTSFITHKDLITHISPCWFSFRADGSIAMANDPYRDHIMDSGIPVVPLISNSDFNAGIAAAMVSDAAYQQKADAIVSLVVEGGFAGINLDFEGPFGNHRDQYTRFVQAVAQPLQQAGKLVTVDVVAQTCTPENSPGSWAAPFDYQALGDIVDYVMIMGYDYSSADAPPQPVSPAWWLAEVIDYAVSQIPKQKIVMGLPFYSRKWTITADGRLPGQGVTSTTATQWVAEKGATWQWDEKGQVPYVITHDTEGEHHLYGENAQSLDLKIAMVKKAGLAGLAFWRLGQETPEMWQPVAHYLSY